MFSVENRIALALWLKPFAVFVAFILGIAYPTQAQESEWDRLDQESKIMGSV